MRKFWMFCAVVLLAASAPITSRAQWERDSAINLQIQNDKLNRIIQNYGASDVDNSLNVVKSPYDYTNVKAWVVQDEELSKRLEDMARAIDPKRFTSEFQVDQVHVYAAPYGSDKFEIFQIDYIGKTVKKDTSSGGDAEDILLTGGGGRRRGAGNKPKVQSLKFRQLNRIFKGDNRLLATISETQGMTIELPGELPKTGTQLVKEGQKRYEFQRMFGGFYSKRRIQIKQGLSDDPEQTSMDPNDSAATITNPEWLSVYHDKRIDVSFLTAYLSANLSPKMGVEIRLGDPEFGLPFWHSGVGRAMLVLKNQISSPSTFKLGFTFPVTFGQEPALFFDARRLNGGWGGCVEGNFPSIDLFSSFNLPFAFNVAFISKPNQASDGIVYNGNASYRDSAGNRHPTDFYRNAFIGQFYLPIMLQFDNNNFFQFSAGLSIHAVKNTHVYSTDDTLNGGRAIDDTSRTLTANDIGKTVDTKDNPNLTGPAIGPHLKFEYVNHQSAKFGLWLEYDRMLSLGGWIELWEDIFRIEIEYSIPSILRAKLPYENPSYFTLSPRLYLW